MLLAVAFFVAPDVAATSGRGENDDETESDDAASLHLDPSPVRRPGRSLRVSAPHVWYRPLLIPADAVTIR